jgi:hypothetical protein
MIKKGLKKIYDDDNEKQEELKRIQEERKAFQDKTVAEIKGEAAVQEPKEDPNEVIRVNISLTKAYKERLTAYSKRKCIPVSMLIRNWIDEHCG